LKQAKRGTTPIPTEHCWWDAVPWYTQYRRYGVYTMWDYWWFKDGHSKEEEKEECTSVVSAQAPLLAGGRQARMGLPKWGKMFVLHVQVFLYQDYFSWKF
jgi:hypothetical protein